MTNDGTTQSDSNLTPEEIITAFEHLLNNRYNLPSALRARITAIGADIMSSSPWDAKHDLSLRDDKFGEKWPSGSRVFNEPPEVPRRGRPLGPNQYNLGDELGELLGTDRLFYPEGDGKPRKIPSALEPIDDPNSDLYRPYAGNLPEAMIPSRYPEDHTRYNQVGADGGTVFGSPPQGIFMQPNRNPAATNDNPTTENQEVTQDPKPQGDES